jgi:hypothetical protein
MTSLKAEALVSDGEYGGLKSTFVLDTAMRKGTFVYSLMKGIRSKVLNADDTAVDGRVEISEGLPVWRAQRLLMTISTNFNTSQHNTVVLCC